MVLQNEMLEVLRAMPACCLILLPDAPCFTIAEVTEDYLLATMRRREELIGRKMFDAFPDNPANPFSTGPENLFRSLMTVAETGKKHVMPVQKYDIPNPEKYFEERYWLPTNKPVFNEDGTLLYIIHTVEEVTNRVLAEKKGFITEWQLKLAFEHSALGMGLVDENGKYIKVNSSFCHILGYSQYELNDVSFLDITFGEDKLPSKTIMKNLITGKLTSAQISKRYYKRTGGLITVSERISAVRDKYHMFQHFVIEIENITEKQEIESQLLKSEQQYQSLFNQNPDAVFSLDTKGYFTSANAVCCDLFKLNKAELLKTKLADLCTFEFKAASTALIQNAEEGKSETAKLSVSSSSGKVKHLSVTAMPVVIDGSTTGVFGIAKDITEAVQTRSNLKKLSLIAEKTVNSVLITDAEERIEWVNQAFQDITGYGFAEVVGKWPSEILHGEKTDPSTIEYVAESIRKKQPFKCEILKYGKDGKPFWVEKEGQPLFNERGELTHYFEIETDITERKKVLEQLIKKENEVRCFAKQLNMVLEEERARIAREIHDEFGQQLVGLKMSISALKRPEKLKVKNDEVVDEMLSDVNKALSSLKQFATELRPGILDSLGLVPSLEWLLLDFQKKSGLECVFKAENFSFELSNEVSICFFRVCQEALTNISKHAYATNVQVEIKKQKSRLMMNIIDNGRGIVKDKLDDPFSMGLIGMRERANLIGGRLRIDGSPEKGTSILLTINV